MNYIPLDNDVNKRIVIRPANLDSGPGFVQLFNTYYKRKTSLEYFKWQFFDSPYESRLFAAFDGDRLIGFFGTKIYRLTTGLSAGFAIDILIDESYRRKGIGYLLETEAEEFCKQRKVSVLASLPNASGNAALKAFGWSSIAKIDTLIKDTSTYSKVISPDKEEYAVDGPYIEFSKINEFKKWRYENNPTYKYGYSTLDNSNFAVTKLFVSPFDNKKYQDIVEISYTSPLNLAKIIDKVFQEATEKNIDSITIWALPHTTLFQLLVKQGFNTLPQERYFCLKMLDQGIDALYDLKKWSLAEIDAEIY